MSETYTKTFEIGTTMTDLYNNCRPAALLEMIQELGTDHANILNMSREYLVEHHHACWILARVWVHMERPIHAGERLTGTTWHREAKGLILYRDTDFFVGEERVGEAVAAWVVADLESRKMLRPSVIETIAASKVPEKVKEKELRLIKSPKEKAHIYDRTVRYSDLDVNGHMNNTKYADVLMDALDPRELKGKFLSELQLNYSQECRAGETMEIFRGTLGELCYIDGCGQDGKRRFEATVQFQREPGMELDESGKIE